MVEPGLIFYDGDGVESPSSVTITLILWLSPSLVADYGDGVERPSVTITLILWLNPGCRETFAHHYLNLMVEPCLVVDDGDCVEPLGHQLQLKALHCHANQLRVQAVTHGRLFTGNP